MPEQLKKTLKYMIKKTRGSLDGPLTLQSREDFLLEAQYVGSETPTHSREDLDLMLTGIEARNLSMRGDVVPEQSHRINEAITDEQILAAFKNAPTGLPEDDAEAQRRYLAQACLKTNAGYWNGHTIFQIMLHLNLVEDTSKPRLTSLGGLFLFQCFEDKS
jgi:hypothetical protein